MTALKTQFVHHRLHMLGCGAGCLIVIAAIILGIPILAVVGTLLCGAMMIGMVWMMVRTRSASPY